MTKIRRGPEQRVRKNRLDLGCKQQHSTRYRARQTTKPSERSTSFDLQYSVCSGRRLAAGLGPSGHAGNGASCESPTPDMAKETATAITATFKELPISEEYLIEIRTTATLCGAGRRLLTPRTRVGRRVPDESVVKTVKHDVGRRECDEQ